MFVDLSIKNFALPPTWKMAKLKKFSRHFEGHRKIQKFISIDLTVTKTVNFLLVPFFKNFSAVHFYSHRFILISEACIKICFFFNFIDSNRWKRLSGTAYNQTSARERRRCEGNSRGRSEAVSK